MDGLDAGGDPAPRRIERDRSGGASGRARSGASAASGRPTGARRSSASRTAASPMAWIWVAIPPAAARPTSPRRTCRVGHPQSASLVGRQRPVGLGFDVLQEPRRARAHRAVGEALLPADPGATGGIGAEDVTTAQAAGERRVEAIVAQARMDAERAAGRHRTGARTPGTENVRSGSGTSAPGSWTATIPSATSSRPTACDRRTTGPRRSRAGCGRSRSAPPRRR